MMKMQGNTTEIDERNLLRLDALLSHGYGLSPQLVMRSKGLSMIDNGRFGRGSILLTNESRRDFLAVA